MLVLLWLLFIIMCIYTWVQVGHLKEKNEELERQILELCRLTGNEDVARDKYSGDQDWYEGCYIGPELKAQLRALKSDGKYDEAISAFCKTTGLPNSYGKKYIGLI